MENERDSSDVKARDIYGLIQGDHARIENKFYGTPRKASLFQLPATDPNFTGRSIEIDKIEAILTSENPTALISAVSGMGGVGKSTLAKAIGNRLKGQYPDGQLYMDLRGQSESPREPIAVLSEFLVDGFGDDPQNLPIELDRLQRLFNDRLTGRKILVVLDNAADAAQVEPLLPRVNGCGALVTSREKLVGLSGIGRDSFVPLNVMTIDEAIALLDRLCGDKTQDRVLTAKLVTLCGSLPLALTIVGRLLFGTASLTLVKLIAELGEERSRLRSLKYRNTKDEIDPKLDVEASFNLSYRGLLPEQQRVFTSVAVLRGVDFGVELAAVLGEMKEPQVQRRLDQLVALALVEMPKDTVGRYRFHDLVREFGREKLETEQEVVLTRKALEWYGTTADQMDDFVQANIRSQRAATIAEDAEQSIAEIDAALLSIGLAWFRAEWLNVLEGIKWAKMTENAEIAVKLFACGMHFAGLQGQRKLVFLEAGEQALEAARGANDRLGEANTLKAIGDVLQFLDQRQDALNRYETAIDIYRQVGDRLGEANTLQAIGDVLQFLKQSQDALNRYETAIDIYRQVGARLGEANTLQAIGDLQEDPANGVKQFQKAMKIYQDIGDEYSQSRILATSLAPAYIKLNQPYQAKEAYEKALRFFEKIDLEAGIELCKDRLKNLNQQSIIPYGTVAPKIGNDRTPRPKKRSFPLWQSAIVLLLFGIGWMAMKPQVPVITPVEQNQRK